MEPKRSIYMNIRVNNIPVDKLSDIKSAALLFRKEVNSILKEVELTDDVYYDFNLTESQLIDPVWAGLCWNDGRVLCNRRRFRRIIE